MRGRTSSPSALLLYEMLAGVHPFQRTSASGMVAAISPYHYTAPRRRIVAADALVAIAAGRYSVPVRYVGQTVDVHETATHYVIVAGDTCIAQHAKAGRHAVVMEPAHYAGLLRPGAPPLTEAPQWDPAYLALGAVEVRDLTVYEALSTIGGGQ